MHGVEQHPCRRLTGPLIEAAPALRLRDGNGLFGIARSDDVTIIEVERIEPLALHLGGLAARLRMGDRGNVRLLLDVLNVARRSDIDLLHVREAYVLRYGRRDAPLRR